MAEASPAGVTVSGCHKPRVLSDFNDLAASVQQGERTASKNNFFIYVYIKK